jgi:hypothetical protein
MNATPSTTPVAQPGQWVRWCHPRLAIARGWFNAFGPGPFEVVSVRDGFYLIRTPQGERPINALWVGPAC